MLTLVETLQYEPVIIAFLIVGVLVALLGAYFLITKKDKRFVDLFFIWSFISIGIVGIGLFGCFVVSSYVTSETITPCSMSDKGGMVASVEGGTYFVYPAEMLKLHINQTREVIVMNEWASRYSMIKDVPGANCPSGAATGC